MPQPVIARKAMKRAAASLAEDKIKSALVQVDCWSDDDEDTTSTVCHLSDFEDLQSNVKRKMRKSEQNDSSFELDDDDDDDKTSGRDNDTAVTAPSNNRATTTDQPLGKTGVATEPSRDGSSLRGAEVPRSVLDAARLSRQKRAEARGRQSNGPMILSRRLSYKLSDPGLSPMLSPIAAVKLWFTPNLSPPLSEVGKTKSQL